MNERVRERERERERGERERERGEPVVDVCVPPQFDTKSKTTRFSLLDFCLSLVGTTRTIVHSKEEEEEDQSFSH